MLTTEQRGAPVQRLWDTELGSVSPSLREGSVPAGPLRNCSFDKEPT
ncbi:hypothetical protein DFQ14_104149 [Halopolyspora algeriensis]|uniref:Uncharacterized protein n=1 Tax=Halopolyspora algeriensis TaxID=1500506 RepID=A0A368VRN0_9ACTN|nr:hypothetical protein DFQ14_104149 [Halopolyspora algeriensis]TQM55920.1 hypothetical protein FHU43_0698 [Halopolyspora algeriensis]